MKAFVSIFAAAVLAGLLVYFLFDWLNAFGLMANNVVLNVSVFVGFIAVLTITSATLATLFHIAIARADHNMVATLEARIRALEQNQPTATTPPSPPPTAAE